MTRRALNLLTSAVGYAGVGVLLLAIGISLDADREDVLAGVLALVGFALTCVPIVADVALSKRGDR